MVIRNCKYKLGEIWFLVDNENGYQVQEETRRFAIDLYNKNRSKRTIKSYMSSLNLFYQWLGIKEYTYLTVIGEGLEKGKKRFMKENFNEFKFWLKYPDYDSKLIPIQGYEEKRTASTVNHIISAVLSFYDFLASEGDIESLEVYKDVRIFGGMRGMLGEMLPSKKVRTNIFKEKETKKKPKFITRAQYVELVNAADNLRDKAILGILFEGGLRISEVIGLYISDLDLKNDCIHVQKHDWKDCPEAATKWNSEGHVFISSSLSMTLSEYITEELASIDTNYLFVNLYCRNKDQRNHPMTTNNIRLLLKRLSQKCGMETVTPHMFRHGLARNMIENDVDMLEISYQLRHKNPSTTARIYAEMSVEERGKRMKSHFDYINDKLPVGKSDKEEAILKLLNGGEDDEYD